MKRIHMFCLAILLIAGMEQAAHAGRRDRTLIVMPSRYTVVQFAFDIARIRPVGLLAYDKGAADEPMLLHAWDSQLRNWKPVDVGSYMDGSLFKRMPKRVFVVGSESSLPPELATPPAWAKEVVPVRSLKVADLANSMNTKMVFSEREWKRLASRHELDIVDENYEERRYGRFGKPGTKYEGPRPVNPLIARFRQIKKGDEGGMEPEGDEEAVEAPVEVDEAAEEAAPEKPVAVPAAEGQAAAPEVDEAEAGGDVSPADK